MAWWFGVIEARHELQNPTSPDKILLLGERLGLGPDSHVLDLAAGRGGPALLLAGRFGCRITCVEQADEFVASARERVASAGLEHLMEIVHADARKYPLEPERYDAALCLGASFVWAGLTGTLEALTPAVRPGGFVAVGEPYWRVWPLPEDVPREEGEVYATLAATVERFEEAGPPVVTVIASSRDDWDAYESLHWLTLDDWLREHPEHADAETFRRLARDYRDRYLRWQRELLGWAIFVGRRP